MGRNAVGFYWTLPVPWAGFTSLAADIEAATKASRTIQYQRTAIRRHAEEHRYHLVHEEVFLEIEPDRGSEYIVGPLEKVAGICRQHAAVLLFVDFSAVQGWRSHHAMARWSEANHLMVETVFPAELIVEGRPFDPAAHFEGWREAQHRWAQGKTERVRLARERTRALLAAGLDIARIAEALNAEGIRTPTGRSWTADNLRKFLKD